MAENRLILRLGPWPHVACSPQRLLCWLRDPFFQRAQDDQRQAELTKTAWAESGMTT